MLRFKMLFKVTLKDMRENMKNKQISLVMILLPASFTIMIPLLLIVLPLKLMSPEDLLEAGMLVPGLEGAEAYLVYNWNTIILPFFVMVPLAITMSISSDSWAGEKERRTAESLLLLPLTDEELFLAKVLASLIPGLVITWACGITLTFIIDITMYPYLGYAFLPNASWLFHQLVLTPILAFFSIFINVWISYRSKDTKSAQQMGGLVFLVFIGFLVGGFLGVITFLTYVITIILGVIDFIFIYISPKVFSRERIMINT